MTPARAVTVLLFLTVVFRVTLVLAIDQADPTRALSFDSAEYIQAGEALRQEGRFTYSPEDPRPQFVRTPGYPLFIAAVGVVFPRSQRALLVVQAALSAITVLVVWMLGRRLWSDGVGLLAAALVAVEPLQVLSAGTLLTESVHTTLLMVFVLGATRVLAQPVAWRWALVAGAGLATATFVRPSTYYLAPLVGLFLLLRSARQVAIGPALRSFACFALPIVLVFGGWQARNHERVDSWRFSGIEGINLYLYGAARVLAVTNHTSLLAERQRLQAEVGATGTKDSQQRVPDRFATPGAYYGTMAREGFSILAHHPLALLRVTFTGSVLVLAGLGTDSVFRYVGLDDPSPLLVGTAGMLLVAFYLLAALGARWGWARRRDRWQHALLFSVAAYVVVASWNVPESRFRTPIMPIVALYAAAGAIRLRRLTRLPRRRA